LRKNEIKNNKNVLKYTKINRIDRQSANHDKQLEKIGLSTVVEDVACLWNKIYIYFLFKYISRMKNSSIFGKRIQNLDME